jgi:nucleoside-diphosphate-sugar epimerase
MITGLSDKEGKRIDISKPFDLPSGSPPQVVIHAAGKAHITPRTPEEANLFFKVNFEGTQNICSALDKSRYKPKAFIFISTVAVYGVEDGRLISESHPLSGSSPYAESKIKAEDFLEQWAFERDITLGILRLPLLAGPHPQGNLAAMIKGIKTGRYLSIGKGAARKSIVWAADIAGLIPGLVEKGGIYNLTDGYHPSFRELEQAISLALHKNMPLKVPLSFAKGVAMLGTILGPRFPLDRDKLRKITATLTFDDAKARDMLDWKPVRVLDKVNEIFNSEI